MHSCLTLLTLLTLVAELNVQRCLTLCLTVVDTCRKCQPSVNQVSRRVSMKCQFV